MVYSNNGVVFVLLLLFAINIIAMSFMFSTWFSKSNVAAAAGALLFFLSYIPYLFIQNSFETLSRSEKLAACVLGPTCISLGANILSIYETSGESHEAVGKILIAGAEQN